MESQPSGNLAMGMIKPFGPSIVKVKLPADLINQFNNYVDEVLADENRARSLDHGPHLAGNVMQEFLLEAAFMERIKWREFIGVVCNEWLKRTNGNQLKDLTIIKSWIVRQFQNEYNPLHHHGGHISGVAYLKLPPDMGNPVQEGKQRNSNGNLVFTYGSPNLFAKATFEVEPEVGDFYLFPNYLLHAVYPFTGSEEERRSVSFNAVLDPEASVY